MKYSSIILLAALITAPALASTPLKFSGIKGWRVSVVEKDPVLKAVFSDSEYVILVTDKNAEEMPSIRVRNLGDGAGLDQAAPKSWASIIFANQISKPILTSERVFKKQGQYNYMAEFQTDTGAEDLLRSIVLGTIVDGKLYILIYEQHRETYIKNLAAIKRLFQGVQVTAEK